MKIHEVVPSRVLALALALSRVEEVEVEVDVEAVASVPGLRGMEDVVLVGKIEDVG